MHQGDGDNCADLDQRMARTVLGIVNQLALVCALGSPRSQVRRAAQTAAAALQRAVDLESPHWLPKRAWTVERTATMDLYLDRELYAEPNAAGGVVAEAGAPPNDERGVRALAAINGMSGGDADKRQRVRAWVDEYAAWIRANAWVLDEPSREHRLAPRHGPADISSREVRGVARSCALHVCDRFTGRFGSCLDVDLVEKAILATVNVRKGRASHGARRASDHALRKVFLAAVLNPPSDLRRR